MPHFEIFIPAADSNGFDVTARLSAPSWTEALRVGLARLHDGADVRHLICDIRDDGVNVTEPKTGRVFKIVERAEAAAQVAMADEPTGPSPAAAPKPQRAPMISAKPMLRPPPESPAPVEGGYVASTKPRTEPVAKPQPKPAPVLPVSRVDDTMGDMFMAAAAVFQHKTVKAAADFIIDLALKAVPAEGGRVLVSSINAHDLYPAAARGSKAASGAAERVPMGQGVIGVAALEGVAIAVSSQELCSPAQRDGRVYGALHLVNKKGGAFTADEINIVDYLASQFAEYVIATGQTDA